MVELDTGGTYKVIDSELRRAGNVSKEEPDAWQIIPRVLLELVKDHEGAKAERAMEALLRMKKIDIAERECAVMTA